MASKRKLEEKKRRATHRRQEWKKERIEEVSCRLLGKPNRRPPKNKFCHLYGTARPDWEQEGLTNGH